MADAPFRERIFVGSWTNVALVNNLLEREGLATIIAAARESRYQRAIYVLNPEHLDHARDIVGRYLRGEPLDDPKSYKSWRCRSCNELIEGQFDLCWKCGAVKM
jgi:hypothetical protein